jgi:hypothetical protein
VVAIMPDRQLFAAQFRRDAASPFPVLTDMDNGYALSLNLAIWLGPDLARLLSSYGRSLPDYQGNDLDAADTRDLRRRSEWNSLEPICRSRLSPAHGGRGTRRCTPGGAMTSRTKAQSRASC